MLTTREAGRKLGVSRIRIIKLCHEGRLPGAFKFSGVWAIPEEAVMSFRNTKGRKRGREKGYPAKERKKFREKIREELERTKTLGL